IGLDDSPLAAAVNAANLSSVGGSSFEALIGGVHTKSQGNFFGETKTGVGTFPIMGLAGVYRYDDNLVLAVVATGAGGAGTDIRGITLPLPSGSPAVTADIKSALAIFELSPAIIYRFNGDLAASIQQRNVYAGYQEELKVDGVTNHKMSLSGTSYTGIKIGLSYRVSDSIRLGFSYKSEVKFDLNGEGQIASQMGTPIAPAGTDLSWRDFTLPQEIGLGVSFRFQENLLVGADAGTRKYSAIRKRDFDIDDDLLPGNESTIDNTLKMKDTPFYRLGLQLSFNECYEVRTGYGLMYNASNPDFHNPFGPPPGINHVFAIGAGRSFEKSAVNAALVYSDAEGDARTSFTMGKEDRYKNTMISLQTGLTYSF
ncbi:MAG: outer membrane protein transport protein, partial [Pseudobdellovibrionaceae bacterium]|nr:outer membrane protein transport protein [Pseudobdellovibrionaceae bacterium]